MLTIAELSKSFGRDRVLRDVSLSVARGEVCILRGANGAGKSTLFEVISGVLDADRGTVTIDGRSNREPAARAAIGYAPANAMLPDHLVVHEWIDLLAGFRGSPQVEVDAAIETWGLRACTGTVLSALSLGQRRRLTLAAAELGAPSFILLDEPTVGLDPDGQSLLVSRVRAHLGRGGGALIATHEPELPRALDARVVVMQSGSIAA